MARPEIVDPSASTAIALISVRRPFFGGRLAIQCDGESLEVVTVLPRPERGNSRHEIRRRLPAPDSSASIR